VADAPDPTVTLTLPLSEAEELSDRMADLLCWCRGYMAGCPDSDKHPVGAHETRELRIHLDAAICRTRGVTPKAPF
jgi:hypothetical protein